MGRAKKFSSIEEGKSQLFCWDNLIKRTASESIVKKDGSNQIINVYGISRGTLRALISEGVDIVREEDTCYVIETGNFCLPKEWFKKAVVPQWS